VGAQFYATAVPSVTSGVGLSGTRRFAILEDGVQRGDASFAVPADHAEVEAMAALTN
jgi:hypothetical protein